MKPVRILITCALALSMLPACASWPKQPAAQAQLSPPRPYLLHLPGISGKRFVDHMLVNGLEDGGVDAEIEIYDWTSNNAGLVALFARERNMHEAEHVAEFLTDRYRSHPDAPIYVTGHSGGSGILIWALERLPEDVQVESILLLAPALSPRYDLSTALRHVRGNAYVVWSPFDPVLGPGTRMFGTIDGVKGDAAGRVGFKRPSSADPEQYKKIVSMKHDPSWIGLMNIGDHIGVMMTPFAREVLAPLIVPMSKLPFPTTLPATQPVISTLGE